MSMNLLAFVMALPAAIKATPNKENKDTQDLGIRPRTWEVSADTGVVRPLLSRKIPGFKPRFWYRRDRLDARPVIWSLYNHPEEWDWGATSKAPEGWVGRHSRYTIIHKPSQHEFWIGSGWGFYRLQDRTNCSCSNEGGRFQKFQQFSFGRAYHWWRNKYGEPKPPKSALYGRSLDEQQFKEHFVKPKGVTSVT